MFAAYLRYAHSGVACTNAITVGILMLMCICIWLVPVAYLVGLTGTIVTWAYGYVAGSVWVAPCRVGQW